MNQTLQQLDDIALHASRAAMATLVATRGTSPRREGAKMWVGSDGRVLGSVTIGGCVDARVITESEQALRTKESTLLSMELGDEEARELGLTCAGAVDVLVEPVALDDPADPTMAAYALVRAHTERGGRAVIATRLVGGGKLVVLEGGEASGSVGDEALTAEAVEGARQTLRRGVSRTVELGEAGVPVFFELHGPASEIVIFGAGHVARPLVRFAGELGMRTTVVDARDRYANREYFPDADEIRVGIPSEVAEQMTFGPASAVVLVAHDYKFDIPVLRHALRSDAGYVGMLGSRRRGATILRMLAEDGADDEALRRVRVPIGLDIGAETAAELALAIVAEIVAARTERPGTPMRERGSS